MTTMRTTLLRYPPSDTHAQPTIADRYLKIIAIVLAGYALDGRGFAYVGIPPVFIGELMLLFGALALISTPRWTRMLQMPQAMVLLPFMIWGLLRTAPFIGQYQLDAARDAVQWLYAIFAFYMAAVLLADPSRLDRLLGWYDRFSKIFLIALPFTWCTVHFLGEAVPNWPWIDQHMIQIKEGDALVHLAGIIAFWASGLGPAVTWRWVMLLTFDVAICGVIDRAGLVSFMFVFFVCLALRPKSIIPWRIVATVGALLSILAVTGISIDVPNGKDRAFSFAQIMENVTSVGGSKSTEGLDGTKEWRVNWWNDIIGYTLRGPYFWGGKGYGINLADDDGYQVGDGTLRSPHNVHMTILARGGVVGVATWALVLATFVFGMAWAHLTARRRGDLRWASLFLFVGCFWCAFVINASFDVFLEGPMGGIWFWSLSGISIACLWTYKHQPREFAY